MCSLERMGEYGGRLVGSFAIGVGIAYAYIGSMAAEWRRRWENKPVDETGSRSRSRGLDTEAKPEDERDEDGGRGGGSLSWALVQGGGGR